MYYEDSVIDEVRMRNDIVDVISQTVQLTKRGTNYFGLCPFHNEKTPSFSVSPAKQMFYCFGCGVGGNVFSYVQKYDNLTYPEAVERLAERAQVALPQKGDPEKARKRQDLRNRLLEVNKEAAVYYYHLLRAPEGKAALKYLRNRGLSDETMHRFGLGYAPLSRDDLSAHLRSKGFSDSEILEAGLAVHDEKKGMRDKFWNRVMFPIQDVNKRVIGFGGRVMGDGEPKYLNSPETLIFDKSRNLYGLMYARLSRSGRVILCEGYMDVISMHQAQFGEACASLGTSFTAGQANVLKRYVKEAFLAYDSDEAGTKAALRALSLLKEAGIRARVIDLSPCKDPDELIRKEGRDALERRIREAKNPFLFEMQLAEKDYRLDDPDEATAFQHLLAEKLAQSFPDALERENYLQTVCARYGIDAQDMKNAVALSVSRDTQSMASKRTTAPRVRAEKKEVIKAERMLLSAITEDPGILTVVKGYVEASDFTDPVCKRIAKILYDETTHPSEILDRFADEEKDEAAQILAIPFPEAETDALRDRALKDMIYEVMKNAYERRCGETDPQDASGLTGMIEGKKRLEQFQRTELVLSDR